eukprot:sb/3463038/
MSGYMSAAFDTVDHQSLLKEWFGIGGAPLMWFESYLSPEVKEFQNQLGCKKSISLQKFWSGCKYLLKKLQGFAISGHWGDSFSEMVNHICGVPQGSLLGPVLFLLYIEALLFLLRLSSSVIYFHIQVVLCLHSYRVTAAPQHSSSISVVSGDISGAVVEILSLLFLLRLSSSIIYFHIQVVLCLHSYRVTAAPQHSSSISVVSGYSSSTIIARVIPSLGFLWSADKRYTFCTRFPVYTPTPTIKSEAVKSGLGTTLFLCESLTFRSRSVENTWPESATVLAVPQYFRFSSLFESARACVRFPYITVVRRACECVSASEGDIKITSTPNDNAAFSEVGPNLQRSLVQFPVEPSIFRFSSLSNSCSDPLILNHWSGSSSSKEESSEDEKQYSCVKTNLRFYPSTTALTDDSASILDPVKSALTAKSSKQPVLDQPVLSTENDGALKTQMQLPGYNTFRKVDNAQKPGVYQLVNINICKTGCESRDDITENSPIRNTDHNDDRFPSMEKTEIVRAPSYSETMLDGETNAKAAEKENTIPSTTSNAGNEGFLITHFSPLSNNTVVMATDYHVKSHSKILTNFHWKFQKCEQQLYNFGPIKYFNEGVVYRLDTAERTTTSTTFISNL